MTYPKITTIRDTLSTHDEEIEQLKAASAELLSVLGRINRCGSPRADRTMNDCADDLQLVVDIARFAINKAKGETK